MALRLSAGGGGPLRALTSEGGRPLRQGPGKRSVGQFPRVRGGEFAR